MSSANIPSGSASGAFAGQIASRSQYRGRVVDLAVDRVRFPDGSEGELEVVRHGEAAAVLACYRAGEWTGGTEAAVVLLRQYRYPVGGFIWEIPAGLLDDGESPAECALRELQEEAGVRASEIRRLTTIFSSPGFTDERIHLFLALGLGECGTNTEASEFVERRELSLSDALARLKSGEISDAKTACALLFAARFGHI